MLPAGESRMELVLRLVETGIDGQSRSSDVMAISRPDDLGDDYSVPGAAEDLFPKINPLPCESARGMVSVTESAPSCDLRATSSSWIGFVSPIGTSLLWVSPS
jgi:hypothetical protein